MRRKSPEKTIDSESPHPATEVLLRFALGEETPATEGRIRVHATRCVVCRRRRDAVLSMVSALRVGELENVPAELRLKAEALLAAHRGGAREKVIGLGQRAWTRLRVLASSFDPAPRWSLAPAGVRGAAASSRYELGAGDVRLEVEWTPSGSAWAIRGRVVSPSGAQAKSRLALEFSGQPRRPVRVGPRGFFGPVRGRGERLRAELETSNGRYRSGWIESPRARPRMRASTKHEK